MDNNTCTRSYVKRVYTTYVLSMMPWSKTAWMSRGHSWLRSLSGCSTQLEEQDPADARGASDQHCRQLRTGCIYINIEWQKNQQAFESDAMHFYIAYIANMNPCSGRKIPLFRTPVSLLSYTCFGHFFAAGYWNVALYPLSTKIQTAPTYHYQARSETSLTIKPGTLFNGF